MLYIGVSTVVALCFDLSPLKQKVVDSNLVWTLLVIYVRNIIWNTFTLNFSVQENIARKSAHIYKAI